MENWKEKELNYIEILLSYRNNVSKVSKIIKDTIFAGVKIYIGYLNTISSNGFRIFCNYPIHDIVSAHFNVCISSIKSAF